MNINFQVVFNNESGKQKLTELIIKEKKRFICMNRAELKTILKKNHVPDFKYNLDGAGRDDERLCLIYDNGIWQVYYSERGVKTTDKHFNSESEACQFILRKLVPFSVLSPDYKK